MNHKIAIAATVGLLALTSACTPAQVGHFVKTPKHTPAPARVVATEAVTIAPLVQTAAAAPQCQTGPGTNCVEDTTPANATYVCGENHDPNIVTVECEGFLPQQTDQTQVGNAPRTP